MGSQPMSNRTVLGIKCHDGPLSIFLKLVFIERFHCNLRRSFQSRHLGDFIKEQLANKTSRIERNDYYSENSLDGQKA